MKAEKRWISPCYLFNMAISRNGLMRYYLFVVKELIQADIQSILMLIVPPFFKETHNYWINFQCKWYGFFFISSTCAFSNRTEDSHYISESRVGTLDTPFTSCTFKVEDPGPQSKVVFGIGKQTHVFGNNKEYLAFICMDGGHVPSYFASD